MAGIDTNLAASALAIALVALIVALGQLLRQYFATADGYRRCQKSVMGEYATKTRLHWRWSEFRFETLYSVPDIFLAGDGALNRNGQVILTGSAESMKRSFVQEPFERKEKDVTIDHFAPQSQVRAVLPLHKRIMSPGRTWWGGVSVNRDNLGERASWVEFLARVHATSRASLHVEQQIDAAIFFPPPQTRLPAICVQERSWDFQPPDVIRPLAKSTLSDIAIIARRMGMKWKIRSLGIVLQYSYSAQGERLELAEKNLYRGSAVAVAGQSLTERKEIYIPRARADRLGCGVIRGSLRLGLPDLFISTQSEIVTALSYIDYTGSSSASLSAILKATPEFRFRVADLVALTTGIIRTRGSNLVQVPAPSDNVHGVTASPVGRRAFRKFLGTYIEEHEDSVGATTRRAVDILDELSKVSSDWDETNDYVHGPIDEDWAVTRDIQYLDSVQDHFNALTKLLCDMERDEPWFCYRHLVGAHVRHAIFCDGGETSPVRAWGTDYKADMEGYFKNLPLIVQYMENFTVRACPPSFIIDAWVIMMLRAMCWCACHFFVPGERVPIQYFGSQLPLYIG